MNLHGFGPADWFEGSSEGQGYELCFADPPDDGTRVRIAHAFEDALRGTGAEPSDDPWLWSGRWALFFVAERPDEDAGVDDEFDARQTFCDMEDGVREALHAIDAVSPIEHAIFWGASALHEWDGEPPPPGPVWPGLEQPSPEIIGRAGPDRGLLAGKVDTSFESARKEARLERMAGRARAKKQGG